MRNRIMLFAMMFMVCFVPLANAYNFKWGGSERIRHEFRKNISDLENSTKDNRQYFKVRTSVWGENNFNDNMKLYTKLTNENLPYIYWAGSSKAAGKSATKKTYRYEINEVVFENLYFDIKNILGLPVNLRLGRQDFDWYGEGFLLLDGTPCDSARTSYFNGVNAKWRVNAKNTLEFIFIKDNKTDDILPIINRIDGEQLLNTTDETGYVLYHKNDSIDNLHWENYYMFKNEDTDGTSSIAPMNRQKTHLNTLGSFAEYKFNPWTLRSQLASQFGKFGNQDRSGIGGYTYLDRDFKNFKWSPRITGGFMYLSGDDRDTNKNEAWDPLFSRWPMFSDLCGLYYGNETEPYYFENLQMYTISLLFSPNKKLKFTIKYNFLRANEQVASTAALFSGTGKTRGQLPQIRMDYKINNNISFFSSAEYFIPGNFYVSTADDALFLKTQLEIKF